MIHFFYEECVPLPKEHEVSALESSQLIDSEGFVLGNINIIFCSDDYLLSINKAHLNHDFYTDIITFSFNREKEISGDLFISVDRAKENSEINNETYLNETSRLVIHGLLHLCGYNDKTDAQSKTMRSEENQYVKMIGLNINNFS